MKEYDAEEKKKEGTDKDLLVDSRSRPITQSLFLEIGYKTKFAIYTLKGYDHCYQGKNYPSLKRLYLEEEDLLEYEFANKYLLDWDHWVRLQGNKLIKVHIDQWREELEIKVRSRAVKDMIDLSEAGSSFPAMKWLADRGWEKRGAGRPSKSELDKETAIAKNISEEYDGDVVRLFSER
jgi:hypothetical protein